MKNLQVPVSDNLIKHLDRTVKSLGTSRSSFVSKAIRDAIRLREMRNEQIRGYRKKPVAPGEFDVWENEQVWSD